MSTQNWKPGYRGPCKLLLAFQVHLLPVTQEDSSLLPLRKVLTDWKKLWGSPKPHTVKEPITWLSEQPDRRVQGSVGF